MHDLPVKIETLAAIDARSGFAGSPAVNWLSLSDNAAVLTSLFGMLSIDSPLLRMLHLPVWSCRSWMDKMLLIVRH